MEYTDEFKHNLIARITRTSAEEFEKQDLMFTVHRMFERANPNYFVAIWNRDTKEMVTGAVHTIRVKDHLMALDDNNKLVTGRLLQRGSQSFVVFTYNEAEAYEIMRRELPKRFIKIVDDAVKYINKTRDDWKLIRTNMLDDELDESIVRNINMNQLRYNRALEQLGTIESYPIQFKEL